MNEYHCAMTQAQATQATTTLNNKNENVQICQEACEVYVESSPPMQLKEQVPTTAIRELLQWITEWKSIECLQDYQYEQLLRVVKFLIEEITLHLDDQDDQMLVRMLNDRAKFSQLYDTLLLYYQSNKNGLKSLTLTNGDLGAISSTESSEQIIRSSL